MTLFAYSLRRASGALVVLLILIWLIQFGVYSIAGPAPCDAPRGCIPPDIERNFYPGLRFQPALANEWKGAALDVGFGLVVILGVAGAWRIHNRKAL